MHAFSDGTDEREDVDNDAPDTQTTRLLAAGVPRSELLFTANEAAAYLKLSPDTLRAYRARGVGPKYIHLKGQQGLRYRFGDLRSWLDSRTTTPKPRSRFRFRR